MKLKIRFYKTEADIVVTNPRGRRRFVADSFHQAKQKVLEQHQHEAIILKRENSFTPPWKPVARLLNGEHVSFHSERPDMAPG